MRAGKPLFLSLALQATALMLPSSAYAWGAEGHSIIARVAFSRLSPSVRAQVAAIRASDITISYDHMDNRTHELRHETCLADTVEHLASWADCVRYSPDPTYGTTAPYHFDDIPWCGPIPAKAAYCANENCGSAALQHYVAQLHDPHTTARDRAVALAFVIHIVGDLHQPLHTIDNRDAGGNSITISVAPGTIPGNRTYSNLHSLWDGGILAAAFAPGERADEVIASLATRDAASYRSPATASLRSTVDTWVLESHSVAVDAYNSLPSRPQCGEHPANGGTITADYVSRFAQPVRTQLARAAVRLGDILTDALGG